MRGRRKSLFRQVWLSSDLSGYGMQAENINPMVLRWRQQFWPARYLFWGQLLWKSSQYVPMAKELWELYIPLVWRIATYIPVFPHFSFARRLMKCFTPLWVKIFTVWPNTWKSANTLLTIPHVINLKVNGTKFLLLIDNHRPMTVHTISHFERKSKLRITREKGKPNKNAKLVDLRRPNEKNKVMMLPSAEQYIKPRKHDFL